MGPINALVKVASDTLTKAVVKGDTKLANKLTKIIDKPDAAANRLKQIKEKQEDFDVPIDTYIHRTNAQGDIHEGNFNYRSGTTPAAAGKGEGIFTSPTSYADQNAAYGPRELGVVTERADAAKLGQGKTQLAMDGPETPETFIPKQQVQDIFEIKPAVPTLTDMGAKTVGVLAKATETFKASIADMQNNSQIKQMFKDEDMTDEKILGMFTDTLRVFDEAAFGQPKKVGSHEKVFDRVSMQELYDKVGRKIEPRFTTGTDKRWSAAKRRNAGATMIAYARGNLGDLLEESMVKTKTGKGLNVRDELMITTNKEFSQWAKSGGRVLMNALNGPGEARNPGIVHHGDWVMNEAGELVGFPTGSTKVEFFSGGTKSELSESQFPSVIKSLNILGKQEMGMDKGFWQLNKTLGKNGLLKERAGPRAEHMEQVNSFKLTPDEYDELQEAYQAVSAAAKEANGGKAANGKQYMDMKEKMFTPRHKALESIAIDTKTKRAQFKAKQGFGRRLDDELEKRFAQHPEGKVYTQYNVDTRGRAYPVDPSGASLASGGAIRHGFTGVTKPIMYGDEGFMQLVDDLVLFDSRSGLSKLEHTGLERHAHFKKNEATYLKQGQEALDNIDNEGWNPKWMDRKDAGPYLRGVMEIARVKNAADKGQPYQSNMMIEIDAPSSGSQHIGAQYGDREILELTSVITDVDTMTKVDATGLTQAEKQLLLDGVPDDAASKDLYTAVGQKYKTNMDKAYDDLAKIDPEKAALFREISDKYLAGERGVVKPIVMKVPYGAGVDTLRLDLNTQLDGRMKLEIIDRGIDPDELMDFHWSGMGKALNDGLRTQYEFKEFNSILGGIYAKAKNRKPFLVEGPSGDMTDLTRYAMTSERTFKPRIKPQFVPDIAAKKSPDWKGQEALVYNAIPKEDLTSAGVNQIQVDSQMISTGMAPNVTHMMDAGFLHKLVQAADNAGIGIQVVHDAFFVHPSDVKAVKELSGKVFQDLHANYNIRQSMVEGVSKATGIPVAEIIAKVEGKGLTMKTDFDISSLDPSQMTNVIRGG